MNNYLTIDLSMIAPEHIEQIRDAIDKEICQTDSDEVIIALQKAHKICEDYLVEAG
jgi:hypothetical protein